MSGETGVSGRAFAEVRGVLHEEPSVAGFEQLLRVLGRAGGSSEELETYLAGALRRWPDDVRVCETGRFVGEKAYVLARALSFDGRGASFDDVIRELGQAKSTHIAHLDLSSLLLGEPDTYEDLVGRVCEVFGALRSLDVSRVWKRRHYEIVTCHGSGPMRVERRLVHERQGSDWGLLWDERLVGLERLAISEEVLGVVPALGGVREDGASPVLERVVSLTVSAGAPKGRWSGVDRAVGPIDVRSCALRFDMPALRALRIESHDVGQYLRVIPPEVFARLERLELCTLDRFDSYVHDGSWSMDPSEAAPRMPSPTPPATHVPRLDSLRHLVVEGRAPEGLWMGLARSVPSELASLDVIEPAPGFSELGRRTVPASDGAWLPFFEVRASRALERLVLRTNELDLAARARLGAPLSRCSSVRELALGANADVDTLRVCLSRMRLRALDLSRLPLAPAHLESLMCSPSLRGIRHLTSHDDVGLYLDTTYDDDHPFERVWREGALPMLETLHLPRSLPLEVWRSSSHWSRLHTVETGLSHEESQQPVGAIFDTFEVRRYPRLMSLSVRAPWVDGSMLELEDPSRWRRLVMGRMRLDPATGAWSSNDWLDWQRSRERGPLIGEPALPFFG